MDVAHPQEITIPKAPPPVREREPRKLDHASINSLAYDLVTGADLKDVCAAYLISMAQLSHEVKNNAHLIEAIKTKRSDIQTQGAFGAAIEAAASETLPYILQDNLSPGTEAAVRSRNMKMFMDYTTQQKKIRADLQKSDNAGPAMGVQVNFNVSPGIRGISASTATITQEQHE